MSTEAKPKFDVILNVNELKQSLAYWEEKLPRIRMEIENQLDLGATYSIKSLMCPESVVLGTDLNTGEVAGKKKYEDVYAKVKAVVARYNV